MSRRQYTTYRSEEEKRNLKVNLAHVQSWEAELESILKLFGRFDLAKIVSSASLIQELIDQLYPLRTTSLHLIRENREKFENWKRKLTVDRLIRISNDYSAPEFLRTGVKDNIVEEIRSSLKKTEDYLAECRKKGVTNSFLVSMFTSKVHSNTV